MAAPSWSDILAWPADGRTKTRGSECNEGDGRRAQCPLVSVEEYLFSKTDRVVLDAPLVLIELLAPDDRMKATLERFHEYEKLGVRHIVQMDPEDKVTHVYEHGDLVGRDLEELWLDSKRRLPFDTPGLMELLDLE
jgi:Putative restriction endonuclease